MIMKQFDEFHFSSLHEHEIDFKDTAENNPLRYIDRKADKTRYFPFFR